MARSSNDLIKQAEDFEEAVRTMRSGELPPISDDEVDIQVIQPPKDEFTAIASIIGNKLSQIESLAHIASRKFYSHDRAAIADSSTELEIHTIAQELYLVRQLCLKLSVRH